MYEYHFISQGSACFMLCRLDVEYSNLKRKLKILSVKWIEKEEYNGFPVKFYLLSKFKDFIHAHVGVWRSLKCVYMFVLYVCKKSEILQFRNQTKIMTAIAPQVSCQKKLYFCNPYHQMTVSNRWQFGLTMKTLFD